MGVWWHGVWHAAGTSRPDIIPGINYTGLLPAGYCDAPTTDAIEVTPSVAFTNPSCANNNTPSWQGSSLDKVTYTVTSGTTDPGASIVVSAAAKPRYEFPNNATTTFRHTYSAAADCRGVVTPVNPTVTQPACTGPGTSSSLSVIPATTDGVNYSYDSTTNVLTATATSGNKLGTLPAGWTSVSDTVATYQVPLVPAGACLVTVSAVAPDATAPSCSAPGSLVLPSATNDGYHWTGHTTDGVGDHTVTAVADTGYALSGQVTWTVTVLAAGSGLDCSAPPTMVTPRAPQWTEADCDSGPSVIYSPVEGVELRNVWGRCSGPVGHGDRGDRRESRVRQGRNDVLAAHVCRQAERRRLRWSWGTRIRAAAATPASWRRWRRR